MQPPTLDQMYETFIKIDTTTNQKQQPIFEIIKTKLLPAIKQLKTEWNVDWYSFLIHTGSSGVPTTVDDNTPYFHIRFSIPIDIDKDRLLKSLPDYCLMTRKIDPPLTSISVSSTLKYNPSLHKKEGIDAVWRIIGEQSELILKIFDSYKDNVVIPPEEIWSMLHYFHNMVGMSAIQCPNCGKVIML